MSVVQKKKARQLWSPRSNGHTQTDRFRRFINERRGLNLQDYYQLHKYSVDNASAAQFWVDLIHFVDLKAEGNLDYAIPTVRALSSRLRLMLTTHEGPFAIVPTTSILSQCEIELSRKSAQRETVNRDCSSCGARGGNRYQGLYMG